MSIRCKLGIHDWRLPLLPYGDSRWHPHEILVCSPKEARFCPRCGLHGEREHHYFEPTLERMAKRWELETKTPAAQTINSLSADVYRYTCPGGWGG